MKYFADDDGDLSGNGGIDQDVYTYLEKLMFRKLWPDEVESRRRMLQEEEEVEAVQVEEIESETVENL